MTLSNLIADLSAIRAHPQTPTNVEGVQATPHGVIFDFDTSDLRDEIAELKEERDTMAADLKQAEAERDELETKLDLLTGEQMDAADREAEIDRFRATAKSYADRCAEAERELVLMRKRKGLLAGFVAESKAILAYLHDSRDPEAQNLVRKIHSYR